MLCKSQTPNQFLYFHAQKLGVKNIDTVYIQFIKPTKNHIPKLGDVVVIDGITGIILTKPVPEYGRKGQSDYGRTSDPTKNNGNWATWWKYKFVAQGENCTTKVYSVGADTKITKFTSLSKF